MKAIICTGYGPPEVLQLAEVPQPTPGPVEVLIRVVSTTVHVGDVRIRAFDVPRGQRFAARMVLGIRRPKHPILGMELSGVVESVGPAVRLFAVGDEVMAFTGWRFGAYAEYACLPEQPRKSAEKEGMVVHKPTIMTFDEAAAGLATGGITALSLLSRADVRGGQEVLVNGASGSVGTYAVQLATYFGARVTGVCSTTNLELVRSLGAETVIDYTQHDVTTGPRTYDVIVDAVGTLDRARARARLKPGGVHLNVIKDSRSPGGIRTDDLVFLTGLVDRGVIRAVIDRTYPLDQIVEAHRYVGQGHKKGHVVIAVADAPAQPRISPDPP
jgi:NADPH:quinone reductase-like Zn-dependent oxidoreductase